MAAAVAGGQHKPLVGGGGAADSYTEEIAANLGCKAGDCFEYLKKGRCQRGDGCHFSHDVEVQKQPQQQQRHGGSRNNKKGAAGNHAPGCLLQVTKIPAELNSMTKLLGHFSKFGEVKTISCGKLASGAADATAATVEYGAAEEAAKAVADPDEILGDTQIQCFVVKGGRNPGAAGSKFQHQQSQLLLQQQRVHRHQQQRRLSAVASSATRHMPTTLSVGKKRRFHAEHLAELKPLEQSKAKFMTMAQKLIAKQKEKKAGFTAAKDIAAKKAGLEALKKLAGTIKLCLGKVQEMNDAIAASKAKAAKRIVDAEAKLVAAAEAAAAAAELAANPPSAEETTVKVVGLPADEPTEAVVKHFEQFGKICSVEAKAGGGSGGSGGGGGSGSAGDDADDAEGGGEAPMVSIRFETVEAAEKALAGAKEYNESAITVTMQKREEEEDAEEDAEGGGGGAPENGGGVDGDADAAGNAGVEDAGDAAGAAGGGGGNDADADQKEEGNDGDEDDDGFGKELREAGLDGSFDEQELDFGEDDLDEEELLGLG